VGRGRALIVIVRDKEGEAELQDALHGGGAS
jgi:hypothetical protein